MSELDTFFASLPDLKNGTPDAYAVVHIATGLNPAYFAFPPEHASSLTNLKRITTIAAVYASRLTTEIPDEAERLAVAFVMSAVRHGAEKSWKLTDADYNASQLIPAVDTMVADDGTVNAKVTSILSSYPSSYADPDIVSKLVLCGAAMVVNTGVILVKTDHQHHFVSPHKQASTTTIKQFFGKGSAPLLLSSTRFEDIVCHKACHPMKTSLMVGLATSAETKEKLLASGMGAAAARVPAKYAPMAAASAIKSLVLKAAELAVKANVTMNSAVIIAKLDAITVDNKAVASSRAKAATEEAAIVQAHGGDIAFCYGLVQAAIEGSSSTSSNLLNAYSLTKIANDNDISVAEGKAQMSAALRLQRELAREGNLQGVGLFGATKPSDVKPEEKTDSVLKLLSAIQAPRLGSP